jgi:hypothetical protein
MIKLIKKLITSKIQINITIIDPTLSKIKYSTTPQVINEPIKINRIRKSNFRFVQESKIEHDGTVRSYYITEEYTDGRWKFVSETLNSDKDKAMQLHLKVLETGNLEPVSTKTVLWEGLGEEETQAWVTLQSNNKEEICKT